MFSFHLRRCLPTLRTPVLFFQNSSMSFLGGVDSISWGWIDFWWGCVRERERRSKSVICLQFRDNCLWKITVIGDSGPTDGKTASWTEVLDCASWQLWSSNIRRWDVCWSSQLLCVAPPLTTTLNETAHLSNFTLVMEHVYRKMARYAITAQQLSNDTVIIPCL